MTYRRLSELPLKAIIDSVERTKTIVQRRIEGGDDRKISLADRHLVIRQNLLLSFVPENHVDAVNYVNCLLKALNRHEPSSPVSTSIAERISFVVGCAHNWASTSDTLICALLSSTPLVIR